MQPRHLVGNVKAARWHLDPDKYEREAVDAICDGVEEWLRTEVESLRFTRPNGELRWKAASKQRSAGGSV